MSISLSSTLPLHLQRCVHQSGTTLPPATQQALLGQLNGWQIDSTEQAGSLFKIFTLSDFHGTMAFVNAVAYIAHEQDHHPELSVSYKHCTIRWSTHSVGGLSINDFICAARVDALSA
jgi:4a-hydroxytetrahydrobiopterin dehydratase